MITEDYISYETAKLLKEKGFIVPYDSFRGVYINGKFKRLNPGSGYGYNFEDEIIEVCSLQMAMKWLREKYRIHADPIKQGNYNDCSEYYTWIVARMGIIHRNSTVADKLSYEEACEAAIKYCLENLI